MKTLKINHSKIKTLKNRSEEHKNVILSFILESEGEYLGTFPIYWSFIWLFIKYKLKGYKIKIMITPWINTPNKFTVNFIKY